MNDIFKIEFVACDKEDNGSILHSYTLDESTFDKIHESVRKELGESDE